MVDTLSPAQRSERMSRIRSKNTKPEVALRRALHRLGFRFRLHRKDLPGKPDIVLPKYRTAIFVHGCFWHGHKGCKVANTPKSNTEFWIAKFKKNRERDRLASQQLNSLGWKVFTVWECEINAPAMLDSRAAVLALQIPQFDLKLETTISSAK